MSFDSHCTFPVKLCTTYYQFTSFFLSHILDIRRYPRLVTSTQLSLEHFYIEPSGGLDSQCSWRGAIPTAVTRIVGIRYYNKHKQRV